MRQGNTLSNWSGEFLQAEREQRFRRSQSAVEKKQLRLLWTVALLCFLSFWPFDLMHSSDVLTASLARMGILLTGVLVLLATWQEGSVDGRDRISSLRLLTAMACYGAVLQTRDAGSGALLLLVLGAYLFSPCSYRLQCLCGVAGSALAVLLAGPALSAIDAAYLLPTNLLSMIGLAQINRGRRRLFRESERLRRVQRSLVRLHKQNTALLHNALPAEVADMLRTHPHRRPARWVPVATVVYADLVGFSALARTLAPGQLVALLDRLFTAFDTLCAEHQVQKIKTLGDGYLAVAGLTSSDAGASAAVALAKAQLRQVSIIAEQTNMPLSLRVGVHSGSLVAGVLGRSRYAFDIWGDTVNVACRLQAQSEPGAALVSASSRDACKERSARKGMDQSEEVSGIAAGVFLNEQVYTLRGCGPIVASAVYPDDVGADKAAITACATSSALPRSQSTV